MIVKFILFCFGILTFETLFSQNRLDCKNTGDCKQGVYSYNAWVCEYENNKLNGISIGFDKTTSPRKIRSVGTYKNDIPTGTWIYFDDEGNVALMITDIKKNDSVQIDPKYYYFENNKPNYIAYKVDFYSSGIVKTEGFIAFDEDFNGDDCYEFGEWKYYNKEGKLIETKYKN